MEKEYKLMVIIFLLSGFLAWLVNGLMFWIFDISLIEGLFMQILIWILFNQAFFFYINLKVQMKQKKVRSR